MQSFKEYYLNEGFFPEEDINDAYRVACALARKGKPLNAIRSVLVQFTSDFADADPEEVEAFVDKVMNRVLADPRCRPYMGESIEAPGSYGKGFPTVYKISSRDVPSLEKTMWMVAYPGGYSRIKWFTADHKNPKLHPTDTPDGHIVAIGKADGGRKFKMEFKKARGARMLCPHDPDTWEPVNIRGGSHESSGEEIHEAKKSDELKYDSIPVKVIVSPKGGYAILDMRTNKRLKFSLGGFDQETLALNLIEAFNDTEWQGGLYPLVHHVTGKGNKITMLEVMDIPQHTKNV